MKRETIHIYRYTEERVDKQERLVLGGGGGGGGGAARNNRDEWRRPREGVVCGGVGQGWRIHVGRRAVG